MASSTCSHTRSSSAASEMTVETTAAIQQYTASATVAGVAAVPTIEESLYEGLLRYHQGRTSDSECEEDDSIEKHQRSQRKQQPQYTSGLRATSEQEYIRQQHLHMVEDDRKVPARRPSSDDRKPHAVVQTNGIRTYRNDVNGRRRPTQSSPSDIKLLTPSKAKKPGIFRVNEPAIRSDSAMYIDAYGKVDQDSNRQTNTQTTSSSSPWESMIMTRSLVDAYDVPYEYDNIIDSPPLAAQGGDQSNYRDFTPQHSSRDPLPQQYGWARNDMSITSTIPTEPWSTHRSVDRLENTTLDNSERKSRPKRRNEREGELTSSSRLRDGTTTNSHQAHHQYTSQSNIPNRMVHDAQGVLHQHYQQETEQPHHKGPYASSRRRLELMAFGSDEHIRTSRETNRRKSEDTPSMQLTVRDTVLRRGSPTRSVDQTKMSHPNSTTWSNVPAYGGRSTGCNVQSMESSPCNEMDIHDWHCAGVVERLLKARGHQVISSPSQQRQQFRNPTATPEGVTSRTRDDRPMRPNNEIQHGQHFNQYESIPCMNADRIESSSSHDEELSLALQLSLQESNVSQVASSVPSTDNRSRGTTVLVSNTSSNNRDRELDNQRTDSTSRRVRNPYLNSLTAESNNNERKGRVRHVEPSPFGESAYHVAKDAEESNVDDLMLALKLSAEEYKLGQQKEVFPTSSRHHQDEPSASRRRNTVEPSEQYRILQQIREEQERRDMELALKVSQEEIMGKSMSNGPISKFRAIEVGQKDSQNNSNSKDQDATRDFLVSQRMALEEYQRNREKTQNRSASTTSEKNRHDIHRPSRNDVYRENLLVQGTMETQQAILSGTAHTVTCRKCGAKLQSPVSYSLVYCPKCETISPA